MPTRVRHHTDDAGLRGIRAMGGILPSRGWGNIDSGVHVEVEPFGSPVPATRLGQPSPKNDLGCCSEGTFVEFDAPAELVSYVCGSRNSGIIPIKIGSMLRLDELRPRYVTVRTYWWQFWRQRVK